MGYEGYCTPLKEGQESYEYQFEHGEPEDTGNGEPEDTGYLTPDEHGAPADIESAVQKIEEEDDYLDDVAEMCEDLMDEDLGNAIEASIAEMPADTELGAAENSKEPAHVAGEAKFSSPVPVKKDDDQANTIASLEASLKTLRETGGDKVTEKFLKSRLEDLRRSSRVKSDPGHLTPLRVSSFYNRIILVLRTISHS